jgi:transcriptional regulator with XRE-family HTH domain
MMRPHMARPRPKSSELLAQVGARVRKLRQQREWTQVEMAEKLGLDRSFLADLERGKTNLSLLSLDTIARGFDVSLSKLLSGL